MRRTHVVIALAVVVAVSVVGVFVMVTGDDNEDRAALREQYVDAIASAHDADPEGEFDLSEDEPDFSEAEARCMAGVAVDVAGIDRLSERYMPEELGDQVRSDPSFEIDVGEAGPTREEAEGLVDGMDRCLGFFNALRDQLQDGFADDSTVTPEAVACMADVLDDRFLREVTVQDFMEPAGAVTDAVGFRLETECGDLLPDS